MANEFVQSLRDIADFLAAHPEYIPAYHDMSIHFRESDPQMVATAARALGSCDKRPSGEDYILERDFGPINLRMFFWKAGVCKKVSKGMKTVTKEVPDPTAPKITVTEEVEDFEWVCPESILAANGSENQ